MREKESRSIPSNLSLSLSLFFLFSAHETRNDLESIFSSPLGTFPVSSSNENTIKREKEIMKRKEKEERKEK